MTPLMMLESTLVSLLAPISSHVVLFLAKTYRQHDYKILFYKGLKHSATVNIFL
jgi:hypothetical protein